MNELRVVWRMATWWQCAIVFAFAALFGWIILGGLRSTTGQVFIHPLIPPYALFLYATLASLVNRRSVVATREGLLVTNGPIPLGHGRKWIPRDEIAFCWHVPIETVSDGGDSVVIWHDVGVATRSGRMVPTFGMIKDAAEARDKAEALSRALGSASDWTVVPVRQIMGSQEDLEERRTIKTWVALTVVGLAIGSLWEAANRWG